MFKWYIINKIVISLYDFLKLNNLILQEYHERSKFNRAYNFSTEIIMNDILLCMSYAHLDCRLKIEF